MAGARRGRAQRLSVVCLAGALGTAVLVGTLVLTATAADASLTGACRASGTLVSPGTPTRTYDPKTVDEVTIPRKGDVHWQASTGVSGDRTATGDVRIEFPPPIGKVTIGEWGKNGKKVGRPGNSGVYHYSLPSLIEGIKIPVSGEHHEPGINCAGAVVVQVKGRSPLAWVALALTLVTVMNLALVMPRPSEVPRVRARGRPVLGAVNGLFLGLFVAADLLFFGVVRLDSVVITIVVIAGVVSGIVLGWWGPLAAKDRN